MDELIAEFLTETNESLEELDLDIVNLERNPNDKSLLSKIFRLMHTIKGTCGFLGLPRLEGVAHRSENVLGRFRDGELEVTPEYVTLILESLDRIKFIVRAIEDTGGEPEGDDEELGQRLDAVFEGRDSSSGPVDDTDSAPEEDRENVTEMFSVQDAGADADSEEEVLEAQPAPQTSPSPKAADSASAQQETRDSSVSAQTLRVSVEVLENLMTMVSELVLTRNQLMQIVRAQQNSDFSAPIQRLNHVVSELQEGVMKTRMQPIGNAWAKLPRIIRDISLELGKKIDLEMRGQDTELDRQVLDMIKDPLTHMVRNSADHGLENPADRAAAGKSETGKIVLNAYHEGGHIIIEISDDGRGLNTARIREKVIANGLASADDVDSMTSQQIQQFIFRAGFSTAEKVTSVSGRGVGMDVVRTNIEKIGGSIELTSREGKGSKFLIKIPLTLAIVSALIVESGGERFAIPQIAVRELVMISAKSEHKIEEIKGTLVFRLRDRLLPLVDLEDLLQLRAPKVACTEETDADGKSSLPEDGSRYIIVTQVGAYQFGLIVSRVYDTEEIVVKPVSRILQSIDIFSGNTILGDGSVIMILDPAGIVRRTGETESSDAEESVSEEVAHRLAEEQKTTSLILFRAGSGAPKAVPLALVSRLEQIDMEAVEMSGDQMLIQYRGSLMPLIPFDPSVTIDHAGKQPVLVFAEHGKSVGLLVDEIVDIVEERVDVQISGKTPGLVGSAIIKNKAMDVIDVVHYLQKADSKWFGDHGGVPFGSSKDAEPAKKRVLLVDDSPFFRNMLTPLLRIAGYDVTTMESASDALNLCESGRQFDVIISDIEMPDMDGFQFAEKVRAQDSWKDTPIVALSSHATPQDIDRGRVAGFSKHVAKFDRDTLLNTLSQTFLELGEAS